MNKYSSAYLLMDIMSIVGILIILCSCGLGVALIVDPPRGLDYIGYVIAVAGSFQGLVLSGVAQIGKAILDGSVAQQKTVSEVSRLSEGMRGPQSQESYSVSPSDAVTKSSERPKHKNYKGYDLSRSGNFINISGVKEVFLSFEEAEKWVDSMLGGAKKISESEYYYRGRTVKKSGKYFFIQGFELEFLSLKEAIDWMEDRLNLTDD